MGLGLLAVGGEAAWLSLLSAAEKLVMVHGVFATLVLSALVMANFERILTLGQPPWRGLEGEGV